MLSPVIPSNKKVEIITLINDKLSFFEPVFNLLKMLGERSRFNILDLIINEFNHSVMEFRNLLSLEVEIARSISHDEQLKIVDTLKKSVHSSITAKFVVNPKLIGGLVIRSGDKVFDASVSNRLDNMTHAMVSL